MRGLTRTVFPFLTTPTAFFAFEEGFASFLAVAPEWLAAARVAAAEGSLEDVVGGVEGYLGGVGWTVYGYIVREEGGGDCEGAEGLDGLFSPGVDVDGLGRSGHDVEVAIRGWIALGH